MFMLDSMGLRTGVDLEQLIAVREILRSAARHRACTARSRTPACRTTSPSPRPATRRGPPPEHRKPINGTSTPSRVALGEDYPEIRESVRAHLRRLSRRLLARARRRREAYPTEFVDGADRGRLSRRR